MLIFFPPKENALCMRECVFKSQPIKTKFEEENPIILKFQLWEKEKRRCDYGTICGKWEVLHFS